MQVPDYQVKLGSDNNWYVDGPGEGLSYHGGRVYLGHRFLNKEPAVLALATAIKSYKFGYKQFQLQMQQCLGLPVDTYEIVNHKEFGYESCSYTDDRWYVGSSCTTVKYESILFETVKECNIARNIAYSTYKTGYGDARMAVCQLINAKCNGTYT